MNIFIINHYAGAPHLGRELRPYFLAKNWQAAGHHVTIAAADHTHLRYTSPVEGKGPELRHIGGVSYLFFSTPRYNDSVTGRGRNIAAFVKELWRNAESLANEIRPDVVIAQSGYPYDFFPAQRIAALSGAKTVLEVRDLWPLHLQDHYRYSSRHPSVRFAEYMLGRAVSSADYVVQVLPLAQRYLSDFGLKSERTAAILSGIAAKDRKVDIPEKKAQRLKQFKKDDLFDVFEKAGFLDALDEIPAQERITYPKRGKFGGTTLDYIMFRSFGKPFRSKRDRLFLVLYSSFRSKNKCERSY